MTTLKSNSTVLLNSGARIPAIALGVYQVRGKQCYDAVSTALQVGYRHIDSAAWYGNEAQVGEAIRNWINANNAERSDIYFTTKLRDPDHGYEKTKQAIATSIDQCGLGYIDLYLIHSPNPGKKKRLEAWAAICDAIKDGQVKSGGVSNYG